MAAVMIRCPKTGQDVPTGIDTDSRTFSDLPSALARAYCPHCGRNHMWAREVAWLASDVSAESCAAETAGLRKPEDSSLSGTP
jgi:hypothetical protein